MLRTETTSARIAGIPTTTERNSAMTASNLRFGRVLVKVDESKIDRSIEKDRGSMGQGDGDGLIKYLTKCAESADIVAYREKINRSVAEDQQDNVKLGSTAAFSDLQTIMRRSSDVLLFIHGYNAPGPMQSARLCHCKKC
jgi:hypothetical protein